MDDFNQVNQVVNDAIKDSSYITVLISSGIYIAYTLIVKIVDLFKAKDRNKPLIEMVSAIKQVSENVVKLNEVLDKAFQDAESKEQDKIKNVIVLGFDSFKVNIGNICNSIIIHNNIDTNKDLIKQNIFRLVSTEYYKLYNVFSAYEINGVNISTKLKDEWIDDITKECLDIIYNGQDALIRISQLTNRLDIIADEHSVFVNNRVFNH
ncbi:hypothetical protein [Phocaeicola coprophilus]|uniref:hypothetical protein n=1 Tax=Phocaeicola coprophilus TaxID=387090 RepID=UPI003076E13F